MLQFIPTKSIREIQNNYDLSPDDISEAQYAEVRQKFTSISSENPLVSVVLIAYNEENNLFKTLVSLSDTVSRFPVEFIVVNNNSKDRTQEIIDKCGVRSVFEKQQGYPFARQAGHEVARGKYIISGDADTLYKPTWVQAMIEPFLNDEGVSCTYSLHAFYTEDDHYPFSLLLYQQAKTMGVYFRHLQRPQLNCGGASMAYRKDLADEVGGYNIKMVRGTDGFMAYQLSALGKVEMVRSKKALIYTSMRRTDMDGRLIDAFMIRAQRYFRNMFKYLTPQREG